MNCRPLDLVVGDVLGDASDNSTAKGRRGQILTLQASPASTGSRTALVTALPHDSGVNKGMSLTLVSGGDSNFRVIPGQDGEVSPESVKYMLVPPTRTHMRARTRPHDLVTRRFRGDGVTAATLKTVRHG